MWYVWADSMAGNANFYFATTLAVIVGRKVFKDLIREVILNCRRSIDTSKSVILLHDSLFAELAKIEKSGLSVRLERPLNIKS